VVLVSALEVMVREHGVPCTAEQLRDALDQFSRYADAPKLYARTVRLHDAQAIMVELQRLTGRTMTDA
jgi:hypothetical protein